MKIVYLLQHRRRARPPPQASDTTMRKEIIGKFSVKFSCHLCWSDEDSAGPTFSMTENVSWYLVIILRMFQEVLAMSSPSGWRTSLAMSIRSIPGWKHNTANKNVPTKTFKCVKSQTPTSCEELPCSRNHHHSAVWVSCDRIKAIHHLTADRRTEQMWGWCSWYLRPSSECECDQVRASRRLCSWRCVSQDGSAPRVWWTLPADWWPARCTEIQDRLKTPWLWPRPEPAATALDLREMNKMTDTGESSRTTADENNTLLTKTWQIKLNVFTLDRTRLFFIRLRRQKTSQENFILLHVQKLIPGREKIIWCLKTLVGKFNFERKCCFP